MDQTTQPATSPDPDLERVIKEALHIQAKFGGMVAAAYLMRAGFEFRNAINILELENWKK